MGLENGALTVIVPPQELVMVHVPVGGALVNVSAPETLYVLVAELHALGVAVNTMGFVH
jgi:hypothetical protein